MSRDDPKRPRKYRGDSERFEYGGRLQRFKALKPNGRGIDLANDHPAIVEGRTLFRDQVQEPADRPRLLISGNNSRKIGRTIMKGKHRGFPMYTLTLEERATCPRSCDAYNFCYGNRSHWAVRIKHGPAFEEKLWNELLQLQFGHPGGFMVRLHILGDFYSLDYVRLWERALRAFPALHVFGFTARDRESQIGAALYAIAVAEWERFAIRFSGMEGPVLASRILDHGQEHDAEAITCPAQLGKVGCCAECALCWHSQRSIAFARH